MGRSGQSDLDTLERQVQYEQQVIAGISLRKCGYLLPQSPSAYNMQYMLARNTRQTLQRKQGIVQRGEGSLKGQDKLRLSGNM